eukprot:364100-Chlamydomonas_euryale.AAC.44
MGTRAGAKRPRPTSEVRARAAQNMPAVSGVTRSRNTPTHTRAQGVREAIPWAQERSSKPIDISQQSSAKQNFLNISHRSGCLRSYPP